MKCSICGCNQVKEIYNGELKTGLLTGWTSKKYSVFQCEKCKTEWNEAYKDLDIDAFYESAEYRTRIENDISPEAYCAKYDKEVLDKLSMTGTGIFRNRTVADIGCGGGSFIDFIKGVAAKTIAIEPSEIYREGLRKKGHTVFAYAENALDEFAESVDVITSFDVIEHVESPYKFIEDAYKLCTKGGQIIIGTPTDYPVLRKMLGEVFDRFIFQVQHPWVLSDEAMLLMAQKAGFKNVRIEYKQKYGLGNLLSWLLDSTPRGDIKYDFIEESVNEAYKKSMSKKDLCEYIILYAEK
ncbi:MAG: class I SAM-dependent methyltransferase [Lachnospiraceae bacterium]|nr:class I SAM-dependent methyltransferase [Lachnospiraceae bacterium]